MALSLGKNYWVTNCLKSRPALNRNHIGRKSLPQGTDEKIEVETYNNW